LIPGKIRGHIEESLGGIKKKHLSNERCSLVGIPGLEPGMTGPESVVLPLHHIPIYSIKTSRVSEVGIPGLEPGMTGPESVVLPLHHIPISLQLQQVDFSIASAKVQLFFESPKFFGTFF
jgi:hypothetical protein